MVTVPEYVPTASPVGFTDTDTVDGVVPDCEIAASQLPPEAVLATEVKLRGEVPLAEKVWEAGAGAPITYEKDRTPGETLILESTASVTATVCGLFMASGEAIVTLPE